MKNEAIHTTASAAKEMASLIRGHDAGQRIPVTDVLHSLAKMITGEATTASEALALLVAARKLMVMPLSEVPPITESQDGLVIHTINELIVKAIGALEMASGESSAAFTGQAPALN